MTQWFKPGKLPTFSEPVSQLVSGEQIREPDFEQWRIRFRMRPGLNRKLWEYLYIAQALKHYVGFERHPRLLGFGVGRERLPAVLAACGGKILATDWPTGQAVNAAATDWSSRSLADLLQPLEADWDPALRDQPLCDPDLFARSVEFRPVDMTAIPDDLQGFDALWSCGSLEHLGGLEAGLEFMERSLQCLKPGGIAVHTTEFNLSSDQQTLSEAELCFYRPSDIKSLARRLRRAGHHMTLNLRRSPALENHDVDRPPYHYDFSINAQVGLYVITSIGLIIRRG